MLSTPCEAIHSAIQLHLYTELRNWLVAEASVSCIELCSLVFVCLLLIAPVTICSVLQLGLQFLTSIMDIEDHTQITTGVIGEVYMSV